MSDPEKSRSSETNSPLHLETGPYILRSLIKDVALSAGGDEQSQDVRITCVEVWKENLYIGTSSGEILHHVQIPADPNDAAIWILASRLSPPVNQQNGVGIQQILLLPAVSKACILSNNTLNFYTLPELSPAFPQLKPLTCGWVGGVDLNSSIQNDEEDEEEGGGPVAIMMCLRNKIRLVNIGETAVRERDIEFGGCLATVRRGNIACVADARSYALVDVIAQQKIPLLPISNLDEQSSEQVGTGTLQDELWPSASGVERSSSAAGSRLGVQDKGHSRSTSLGIFRTESPGLGDSPRNSLTARHGFDVPAIFNRQSSPRPPVSPERRGSEGTRTSDLGKPLPAPPGELVAAQRSTQTSPTRAFVPLRPIIASPNESEFLLVTGTAPNESSVGMFVNSDGDVVRGSMEFASFPESMLVDGKGIDLSVSTSQVDVEAQEEGYVLSVVRRELDGEIRKDVEIQRWDVEAGEGAAYKSWLGISTHTSAGAVNGTLGIRKIIEEVEFDLSEVVEKLAPKAIRIVDTDGQPNVEKVTKRENEERTYYQRMSKTKTAITLWTGDKVYWTMRNPLILRLDARLRLAEKASSDGDALIAPQRKLIESLINDLRGQRSRTELEFYTLSYIRQKAALLLFIDLVLQTTAGTIAFEHDKRSTEEALVESDIDPRFVLHFLPGICDEILQAPEGIWVQGGIKGLVELFLQQHDSSKIPLDPKGPFGDNLLHVIKRFLLIWRRKRGNPSVIDGEHVFPTVDAALLRILLTLDEQSPRGPATAGSVRAELNTVVDSGVECFDRAVQLLEQHRRLYILSRLYQSRKSAAMVLATWKRIIAGEEDAGGEFVDGEHELKVYLTKLRNRKLVEEYGTWLAARNPKLGVQVFADDSSRTTWTPADALALLRKKAPAAVKEYLEYLVFAKKQTQHINELIAYYLDIVVDELASSPASCDILTQTYETYRALQPPKPTYRQFIEDNAVPAEWWQSRLRLLQLLGGTQGAAASYDVETVLRRLQAYEDALVPEMIILNGRQGQHGRAIRLLTHGLGDFDMAISYCLRGGYSTSPSPSSATDVAADALYEQQATLFKTLLTEFLSIEDVTDRIERTSELLERFGGWFEVEYVLGVLPSQWSVEIFGGYIARALGRLVRDRNESRVVRALTGSQNLRLNVEKIERIEELGSVVEGVRAG
jgi:hypothetical protein